MRPVSTSTGSPASSPRGARSGRRGAALLLSLLILLVLVAIVIQINVGTSTDARVARNDVGLTTMDLAVESALLQVGEQLATDGESAVAQAPAGGGDGAGGAAAGATPPPGAAAAPGTAGEAGAAATDSRKDEWARPQRTTINDIRLRILVQDEDGKINVLKMLDPDEKEAQAAFDTVVRCLDLCREGTQADIGPHTADEMTRAMLEHMKERKTSKLPRPALLSDDPKNEDQGLPLSLKEFAVLPPFDESHFRDFRDEDGEIVHSIGSFLTVWSSVATVAEATRNARSSSGGAGAAPASGGGAGPGGAAPGQGGTAGAAGTGTAAAAAAAASGRVDTGGWAVNVNTAPVAVLKALFDDRELHPRFWDKVVEYRNLEEEEPEDAPEVEEEPPLDEFGEPIIDRRVFDSLAELAEVEGYNDLPAAVQAKLNHLLSTQSRVFSVFVVARRSTAAEGDTSLDFGSRKELEAREQGGDALLRVVRSVVWRHAVEADVALTPLVRWEVLDYSPYEVQDYPDEDR